MKPHPAAHRPAALLMAYLFAIVLFLPWPQAMPPASGQPWNSHGDFATVRPYDSGHLVTECYSNAPWGRHSWGVESTAAHTARFVVDAAGAHLSGQETEGQRAQVRYTQGTAWGKSACGAIPWNRPAPLPIHGQQLTLSLDVRRDLSDVLGAGGWVALVARVWLVSPALDKPLALSLLLYHSAPEQAAGLAHANAYDYQHIVGTTPAGEWQAWHIPLNEHIAAALAEFDLAHAADTLQLAQLDFAIEMQQAASAATIDHLFLRYAPITPTPTLPVQAETETPTPTPTATFPISYETDVPTATPTPTLPVLAETATPTATGTPKPVAVHHFLPLLLK